jgi:hypothetical protein
MKKPLAALAAVCTTAGIVGVLTAHSAQGSPGRTLRFAAPPPAPRDFKQIDVPPKGLSMGDQFVGAISLKVNGKLVGRAMIDCTANDQTFGGRQCTLDLVLRNGIITSKTAGLDRKLPGQSHLPGDVYAVTGGTGAFTGADGTATIVHGAAGDVIVVRLMN